MSNDNYITNFANLPLDLLISIFVYLNGKTILRCSIICKNWKKAIDSNNLWKCIYGKELEKNKFMSIKNSILINMKIAEQWLKEDEKLAIIENRKIKTLKQIYIELRRNQNTLNKKIIFP